MVLGQLRWPSLASPNESLVSRPGYLHEYMLVGGSLLLFIIENTKNSALLLPSSELRIGECKKSSCSIHYTINNYINSHQCFRTLQGKEWTKFHEQHSHPPIFIVSIFQSSAFNINNGCTSFLVQSQKKSTKEPIKGILEVNENSPWKGKLVHHANNIHSNCICQLRQHFPYVCMYV